MKIGLIIIAAWSTVLLLASLIIVVPSAIYAGPFYLFTLPYIILSGLLVVVALLGIAQQKIRKRIFWAAVPMHGLLYLPYRYAINRWPGGDDGAGMAWIFLVGGGSYIAAIIAVILITIAIREKRKGPNNRLQSPSHYVRRA